MRWNLRWIGAALAIVVGLAGCGSTTKRPPVTTQVVTLDQEFNVNGTGTDTSRTTTTVVPGR
jgi:outer membrane murein-binding lipoprotein Lpp